MKTLRDPRRAAERQLLTPTIRTALLTTLFVVQFAVGTAAGQNASRLDPPPPEMTTSMGLPAIWRPEVGAGFYLDHDDGKRLYGAELRASLYHPIANPVAGVGLQVEGLFRAVNGRQSTGAVRLMIPVRYLGLAWGWEYDFGRETVQSVFQLSAPLRRGGLFGRGDTFHVDLSGSTVRAGISVPLGNRWMGKTRPSSTRPSLPDPPRPAQPLSRPPDLGDLREAARWVRVLTTPFIDQWSTPAFLRGVDALKRDIDTPSARFPSGAGFTAAIEAYHDALVHAFTEAAGRDPALGQVIAARAREVLLDDVILPYNRLLGQRRKHDSLLGLGVEADRQFAAALAASVPADRIPAVRAVFAAVLTILEDNRRASRHDWGDGRLVWIPLHYALRQEDHDSQDEIDALIERALRTPFTDANEVSYVVNQQFHIEVARQIREARDYHVLWIHDFKGKNAAGDPDRVGFEFVTIYLRALTAAVRAFDERGVMPQYIILLDQYFYGGTDSARWMRVLRDPLDQVVHLPAGFDTMEGELRDIQQELRDAVAGSARLQAGLRAYGRGWLENQVRVHVNITNPADPSFTSAHLLTWLVLMPDDMFRDHRKISFFDVTETDPAKGEVIFAGMGIAEHYTGGTWEDRGVLLRGPAALEVKAEARRVLLQQGFTAEEIPRGLRPLPRPDDYEAKVAALRAARGVYNVRAFQAHNATGYGQKWSTVARAMLYDLMPAGSTIIVPDSLWNSPLWASMLMGDAFRGARVFVIAPSPKNAPGAGALVMSRAAEIFARFLLVQLKLGDQIARVGGRLRTGIYNVDGPLDLVKELDVIIEKLGHEDPDLRDAFPFDAALRPMLQRVRNDLVAGGFHMATLAPDAVRRDPKIHLKSQILVTRQVLETLVPRPDMVPLAERYVRLRAEQLASFEGSARALTEEMDEAARRTLLDWWEGLSAEQRTRAVGLLTVGSNNMDIRGQVVDGEVSLVVAGLGALSAYLNFAYVAHVTTWVESVDELETLLPEKNALVRWLARYLKKIL